MSKATTPLTYQPPPPPDRLHLVCDRAGFTLTLPPKVSAAVFNAVAALVIGVSLGWAALKMPPPGKLEASWVWFGWGVLEAELALGAAVGVVGGAASLRSCRALTTLSLHHDTLVRTMPGVLGPTTLRLKASDLDGAEVYKSNDDNGGTYLA